MDRQQQSGSKPNQRAHCGLQKASEVLSWSLNTSSLIPQPHPRSRSSPVCLLTEESEEGPSVSSGSSELLPLTDLENPYRLHLGMVWQQLCLQRWWKLPITSPVPHSLHWGCPAPAACGGRATSSRTPLTPATESLPSAPLGGATGPEGSRTASFCQLAELCIHKYTPTMDLVHCVFTAFISIAVYYVYVFLLASPVLILLDYILYFYLHFHCTWCTCSYWIS